MSDAGAAGRGPDALWTAVRGAARGMPASAARSLARPLTWDEDATTGQQPQPTDEELKAQLEMLRGELKILRGQRQVAAPEALIRTDVGLFRFLTNRDSGAAPRAPFDQVVGHMGKLWGDKSLSSRERELLAA